MRRSAEAARYAIYYAPPADSPLSEMGAAWLGRDAYTGERLARPAVPGLEGLDLDALTDRPRHYGFHATLKAPFELADGRTEDELMTFAADFAARQTAFEAAISPGRLADFLAFRLDDPCPQMAVLHEACVRAFDGFRAPPREAALARRRQAALTVEQESRLVTWGYPYIFEDFRFHMTLTGAIRDEALAGRALTALQAHFAEVSGAHRFGGVAVFRQENRAAPFRVAARFAFSGDAPARSPGPAD